jgi:hypothetical protein
MAWAGGVALAWLGVGEQRARLGRGGCRLASARATASWAAGRRECMACVAASGALLGQSCAFGPLAEVTVVLENLFYLFRKHI